VGVGRVRFANEGAVRRSFAFRARAVRGRGASVARGACGRPGAAAGAPRSRGSRRNRIRPDRPSRRFAPPRRRAARSPEPRRASRV